MFQIYKGGTTFKQWSKGNKLIMDVLPVGADVLFYNETYSDSPIKSDVYEITNEDDEIIKVCDVPNTLLTKTEKIKVCVGSVVTGKYGINHSMVGPREKYFEVEPADRPSDYVEDPGVGGSVSSWNDLKDKPFGESLEVLGEKCTVICEDLGGGFVSAVLPYISLELVVGKEYKVVLDGVDYSVVVVDVSADGDTQILLGDPAQTFEQFPFTIVGSFSNYTNSFEYSLITQTAGEHTVEIFGETIHTLDPKYLPDALFGYEMVTLFDGTVTTVLGDEDYPGAELPIADGIIIGQEYIVELDGKTYNLVGYNDGGYPTIGAPYGDFTEEEPFQIYVDGGGTYFSHMNEGDYALKVCGTVVKPLDPKYLPALTSPNGTKYKLSVADDGTLSATAI